MHTAMTLQKLITAVNQKIITISVQKILSGRVKLSDEAYNLLICGGQDTGKLSHVGAYSCEPKVNSYNSCPKQ